MRAPLVVAAAVVLAAAGFGAAGWSRSGSAGVPATNVRVIAYDFSFSLSRPSAPAGPVRFTVVNRGVFSHDFTIAGRKTRVLRHGESAVLTVVFRRSGRFVYRCTVPGEAAAGMRGAFTLRRPVTTTTTTTTAVQPTTTTPAGASS